MNIERGWQVEFDEEQILRMEGESLTRVLARPTGRDAWRGALADARELTHAAAAWDYFPIAEIRHGSVKLSTGDRLSGGPLAAVVAGASDLGIAVCTIGAELSSRAREHQRGNDMLRGLLLDALGTWAVDKVRQELCCRMEDDAAASGLRVSTSLSPGESEWAINDQAVLFSLLDAKAIGVTLSSSLIMTPLKSLSLVMGRGSGPLGAEGESHCDYCTVKDRCAYRERRTSHEGKGLEK
jgi:hypothetical protein